MRRIQVYSPKAARMLVLFSYDCVAAWALAEGSPQICTFCEYPGFIPLGGTRLMADFWLRSASQERFIKIEGGIELWPELPEQVPIYVDAHVSSLSTSWLTQHKVWVDNWLQINPYLVTNARFVTSEMLDRVGSLFSTSRPLFEVEHALRDVDAQLVRTAVFMLMHQGKLCSDDLFEHQLQSGTVFRCSTGQSDYSRLWPA